MKPAATATATFLCCTKIQLLPISCRWLQKSYCFCADDTGNGSRSSSSPFPVKYVPKKPKAIPLEYDAAAARTVRRLTPQKFISDDAQSQPQPRSQRHSEHQIDHNSPTDNHEDYRLPLTQPLYSEGKMKEETEHSAIKLLALRAYTAVELRKKLQQKRFSLDVIQLVISDFQNRGLINDCLYAESFSRSRWSSSTWGPTRIKQVYLSLAEMMFMSKFSCWNFYWKIRVKALFKKGVSEVDSEKAIEVVFRDGESDGDKDFIHGLSVSSMDRLYVQAAKQWLRRRDVPRETQKSRIIRWLQYRGFSWGVISHVVKKLEDEYPN